jgi:hypothetical protein
VVEHEFETHARQFNWALNNCDIQTKWTLRIDADERLTPALCHELENLMAQHADSDVNGVSMEADLVFLGKTMRHGGHNKRKLMLFKTGIGEIEDREIDEHTQLLHGTSVYCKEKFVHYDFKNLSNWIGKLNWYAARETRDYINYINGKSMDVQGDQAISATRRRKYGLYYKFPKFIRPWLLFCYNYIFRLGILDGRAGYVYNYMYHYWYRSLVDAMILEYETTGVIPAKSGALK